MKMISFGWTAPALVARRKTVTRRDWNDEYAARWREGEKAASYNRLPRVGGVQIGVIRLTQGPYKELTSLAPESDWEAEGFKYMTELGALVAGKRPAALWQQWHDSETEQLLWVVRFEILEIWPNARDVLLGLHD